MNTPICDFVKAYADDKKLRLHMPGHKGKDLLGIEELDITEIDGADVLYSPEGIIRESENNASALFGTARTVYSAEGSSLAIRAMLYLVTLYAKSNGEKPVVLAARNAHKAFINAAAVLDFDVRWLYPDAYNGIISCKITGASLDAAIASAAEKPTCFYVTSPDYLGNTADICELSAVCRKYGVLLIVDNAHGAYLNFLPESRHPMALGADMCCDSAHKTLPVLTGGAYLHISNTAPKILSELADDAMALFASTSPSYLIMQSLDLANAYISDGYSEKLCDYADKIADLKKRLINMGFALAGDEPMKITVMPKAYGYTGIELAKKLAEFNIVCEFADPDYVVMMHTPENGDDALVRIEEAFSSIAKRREIKNETCPMAVPEARMSAREAVLSLSREVDIQDALGEVLASVSVSCPPAIPIAVCGEVIDENVIDLFKYYGIEKCRVVVR